MPLKISVGGCILILNDKLCFLSGQLFERKNDKFTQGVILIKITQSPLRFDFLVR